MIKETSNHTSLINFYIEQGLEFQQPKYVGEPLFSYFIEDGNILIAAITVTTQNNSLVIDDLAVQEAYRNKGLGRRLVNKAIDRISASFGDQTVFAITKEPEFFRKMGFQPIERSDAPDFSICFECEQYKKSCFPVPMELPSLRNISHL